MQQKRILKVPQTIEHLGGHLKGKDGLGCKK